MNLNFTSKKGFTLIELLVVISIIALLSSLLVAAIAKSRVKARDTARIQNARQLALALEQYEQSNSTYKISNAGLNNEGGGYVSKGSETPGYTNSVVSALKSAGYYSSDKLIDPVFGTDNYYVGLCTSTNAYNVFVKLEQTEFNAPTSTVANTCGGPDAVAQGFTFIGSTTGGNAGVITPTVNTNGFAAAYEEGMGPDTVQGGGGLTAVGAIDESFNAALETGGGAYVGAVQSDGKILIAGAFTLLNESEVKYIARLNSDGSVDNSFNANVSEDVGSLVIQTVVVQPDGKILIGGWFAAVDGVPREKIARLNSNGSLDTTFNPGSGATGLDEDDDSLVGRIILLPNGKIFICGAFSYYNSIRRNHIALLNSDGSLDTSFDPQNSTNIPITSMAVQSDGKIIIVGPFNTYNSVNRNNIARINTDGSLDESFGLPGTYVAEEDTWYSGGLDDTVNSVIIQPDGKLLVMGGFENFNEIPRNHIARLNSNGSLDTTFDPGSGPNGSVYDIKRLPDGKIIITGSFTSYKGEAAYGIARININGSFDIAYNSVFESNDGIGSVAIQSDGKILFTGWFTLSGASTASIIARLK